MPQPASGKSPVLQSACLFIEVQDNFGPTVWASVEDLR
ncbi:hypothetical protein FHS52_000754 [Erythromicrobium ramosum]|uniref:Uncharacterized protein n=1 Tax=Erythrobacter ramosus TaxID=35811 RepID=A0ABR6HVY8_9SPHN|nr:hypothetical protein [Erythrobacter ramosus]